MRLILQRVRKAEVAVEGQAYARIDAGWCVLVGFAPQDNVEEFAWAINKILKLRAFGNGIEESISEAGGEILVVSQFTLYADARKGRRPSFSAAAKPDEAREKYHTFMNLLTQATPLVVKQGVFGAAMVVSLENDGPYTLILDSAKE